MNVGAFLLTTIDTLGLMVFVARLLAVNLVFITKFVLAKLNLTPLLIVGGVWFGAQLVWLGLSFHHRLSLKRVWTTITAVEANNQRQAAVVAQEYGQANTRDELFKLTQAECYLNHQASCQEKLLRLEYLDPNHPTTRSLESQFLQQ